MSFVRVVLGSLLLAAVSDLIYVMLCSLAETVTNGHTVILIGISAFSVGMIVGSVEAMSKH